MGQIKAFTNVRAIDSMCLKPGAKFKLHLISDVSKAFSHNPPNGLILVCVVAAESWATARI